MMLVQKQPHFSMSLAQPFLHAHRRHPSAPPPQVHVVQPTRTPGLLSLSRPPRVHQPPKGSPRPRPAQAQPAARSPRPAPAEATATATTATTTPLKPAVEISARGRVQGPKNPNPTSKQPPAHASPTQRRSASQAAPSRRRQPSPDPFKAAPAPAPAPTNAKQRPHPHPQPIPVRPKFAPAPHPALSRSDPVLSHMPTQMPRRKPVPVRAATLDGGFPVCDDTAPESRPSSPSPLPALSSSSLSSSSPPSSPTLARAQAQAQARAHARPGLLTLRTPPRRRAPDGPRTAPLAPPAPFGAFPFPSTSPPTGASAPSGAGMSMTPPATVSPKRRGRAKHLSEGGLLPLLFPPFAEAQAQGRSRSSERAEKDLKEKEKEKERAALFASSMFQNSPSPEELPPPLFA
ncbi:hypothetical protein B0H15DRAFT_27645 [Mycena belliarum]|uniref:Uncharacterized protein n=1 Tax=Mycena belliarum TaxID=1033014 RepID=A0AAD6UNE9_9AGAR|nr:hypothetical protein B0H15DRAFT_27645 [Mycena belliae]